MEDDCTNGCFNSQVSFANDFFFILVRGYFWFGFKGITKQNCKQRPDRDKCPLNQYKFSFFFQAVMKMIQFCEILIP